MQIDHNDLYPYLLVNIGSGVSMIKVLISVSDQFTFIVYDLFYVFKMFLCVK